MRSFFQAAAAAVLAGYLLAAFAAVSRAAEWRALQLPVPGGTVSEVEIAGRNTFILAGRQWMALTGCLERRLCFTPKRPPARIAPPLGAMAAKSPPEGLPDGGLATIESGDIRKAWFAGPTEIYRHGILGDRVEASMLLAEDAGGNRYAIAAGGDRPPGAVFEDLTPRIADLDGDGRNEIVAIHTFATAGAALAVYGLAGGKLELLAQTPPIGRPNRWRNPSAIADFHARPGLEIAEVVTPHIGGTLRLWSFDRKAGRLIAIAEAAGFSNHVIGSRQLSLSAAADIDGDGFSELAVPSADRTALRIMKFSSGKAAGIAAVALPAPIDKALAVIEEPGGPAIIAGLESGALVLVAAPDPATFCIENHHGERLLFAVQSAQGKRSLHYLRPARSRCFPRPEIATVWAFENADALEGCSVLVPATAKGLELRSYASFDNCDWRLLD